MRYLFGLVVVVPSLLAASAACSPDAGDPIGDGLRRINQCEVHADFAISIIPVGREFDAMQQQLASDGGGSLDEKHSQMRLGFTETVHVGTIGFAPTVLGPLFEPGVTTWDELLHRGGLRAVADYSNTFSGLFRDRRIELWRRYADQLEWECAAREAETIEYLCFEDPDPNIRFEACRAWENVPTRNRAIVTEVCAQVPYLVFCDPDDPPPWLPPAA